MGFDMTNAALNDLITLDRELRHDLRIGQPPCGATTLVEAIAISEQTIATVVATKPSTDRKRDALIKAVLDAQSDARDLLRRTSSRRISAVARSMSRLRTANSVDELIRHTCAELTGPLEFHRVTYSAIECGYCTVGQVSPEGDSWPPPRSTPRPLSPAERRCVAERRPGIVDARSADPLDPVASTLGKSVYVVAPVLIGPDGCALLHATRTEPWTIDSFDVQLVGIIATAFSAVHERQVRAGRLQRHRQATIAAAWQLIAETESLSDEDLDFSAVRGSVPSQGTSTTARLAVQQMLTPREGQVLRLIVSGASNTEIAEDLVVSVETVKSHVKRILRKLGAVNRSAAISLYLEDQRAAGGRAAR